MMEEVVRQLEGPMHIGNGKGKGLEREVSKNERRFQGDKTHEPLHSLAYFCFKFWIIGSIDY